MSRQVCGNCLCPYGDDGKCACVEDQATIKEAGIIYLPSRWSGDTHSDKDTGCVDVEATEQLIAKQAAEIEHLKFALNQESLARENVSQMRAEFASKLDKSEALLRQALEALEKTRAFHQQNWSSEEITPKLTRDTITAIKQHLGEDHGN